MGELIIYRILVLRVNTIEIMRVYCIYNGGSGGERARCWRQRVTSCPREGTHSGTGTPWLRVIDAAL